MHNFTDREIAIIQKIIEGKSYNEIGNDLNISFHTVKAHIGNIYQKTGFNNKMLIVVYALQNNLVKI